MKNKIAPRSSRLPDIVKETLEDISEKNISFKRERPKNINKKASVQTPLRKVPITDSSSLGELIECGLGVYKCSSGEIWRVVKTAEGEFLERDDALSLENEAIVNTASKFGINLPNGFIA